MCRDLKVLAIGFCSKMAIYRKILTRGVMLSELYFNRNIEAVHWEYTQGHEDRSRESNLEAENTMVARP